ncbi:MAG TPA: hypothetical protein VJR89_30240 [Polyangiales bacterium]|nr:hypothetical protein [Polyangiales bacterium]
MNNPAKNEGEGNKTADREYRQGATRHAQSGRSQEKAREAERAIDSDEESQELEEAERAGKSKQ